MKQKTKRLILNLFLLFFTTSISVVMFFFNSFEFLENKFYDSRIKFSGHFTKASEDICLITLDQESLDWAKEEMGWSWPWPRAAYADIVNYFKLTNSNALIFDVLFTEPSVYGPEDDEIFAKACAENGKVIHTLFEDKASGKKLFPVSPIKEAAADLGVITSSMDDDDIIRRAKLFFNVDGEIYTSLGTAPLFLHLFQNPEKHISQGLDYSTLITNTLGKSFSLLQEDSTVNLRFQSSIDDYIPYRASDILKSYYAVIGGEEPLIPPENFENTYTFFAYYAPGLFDICSVPNNQVYPGVGVHITVLDNLLNNQFIKKVPVSIHLIWIVLLAIFGYLTVLFSVKQKTNRGSLFSITLIPIFTLLVILLFSYILFVFGFWIKITIPLFAYLLSFISIFLFSYAQEGKQRHFIKDAFAQYVSPSVIESLIENPKNLKLGGEKRNLGIFFSDIEGFTSISENMPPEELTEFLNDFLSLMSNIILKTGGTIDKYEGDAIIAFWNAPTDVTNFNLMTLQAAMECQEKLEEMRAAFTYRLGRPLFMRIGLNSGEAVVGNLGSKERFDYTMIGDSVNLAARLEGLNKEFGTYTLCTKALKDAAEKEGAQIKWREIARVAVVGKKTAVTVFEPLSEKHYKEKEKMLKVFDLGRQCFYRGDFIEAQRIFEQIAEEDKTAAAYIQKCKKLARHLSKNSDFTIENWKGIWIASGK